MSKLSVAIIAIAASDARIDQRAQVTTDGAGNWGTSQGLSRIVVPGRRR